MTIYNTPSLPPCRVIWWNSIFALNSWTQNCLFYASESFLNKHECKNIFMVILLILIHRLLSTLHVEEQCVAKQCTLPDSDYWFRNITEPVREYFAHFRYQQSHSVHTFFLNAYWWAQPVSRDLKILNLTHWYLRIFTFLGSFLHTHAS